MKTDTYTPTKIETWPVREYEAVKVWRATTADQCRDDYATDGAFCALGVLGGDVGALELGIGDGEHAMCPLCDPLERLAYAGAQMVIHWNDWHKLTFKEIADLAEAYPHLVFTEAQS